MKHRFDINTSSGFNDRPKIAERTKARTDPDDPAPDLTLQVAVMLARDEHPRTRWEDYSYEQQATYISNAEFLIVNVVRWTREFGYGS